MQFPKVWKSDTTWRNNYIKKDKCPICVLIGLLFASCFFFFFCLSCVRTALVLKYTWAHTCVRAHTHIILEKESLLHSLNLSFSQNLVHIPLGEQQKSVFPSSGCESISPCLLHFSKCFLDGFSGFPVKTNSSESRLHSYRGLNSVTQTSELSAIYGKKRNRRGSWGRMPDIQCIPQKCAYATDKTGPSLISMLCRTWTVKFPERSQCSKRLPQGTVYFPFSFQSHVGLIWNKCSSQC